MLIVESSRVLNIQGPSPFCSNKKTVPYLYMFLDPHLIINHSNLRVWLRESKLSEVHVPKLHIAI